MNDNELVESLLDLNADGLYNTIGLTMAVTKDEKLLFNRIAEIEATLGRSTHPEVGSAVYNFERLKRELKDIANGVIAVSRCKALDLFGEYLDQLSRIEDLKRAPSLKL